MEREYGLLESKLKEEREKSKQDIVKFLEQEVDPKVTELAAHILKIEADISNTHQVYSCNHFSVYRLATVVYIAVVYDKCLFITPSLFFTIICVFRLI